jgi:ribosome production factor 2
MDHRAPKVAENPKKALFLRGTTCSQIVQDALGDLFLLRQPLAKRFTKKNGIHPFEDASSFGSFRILDLPATPRFFLEALANVR